ncbi:MAG: acyl carrier protein [Clostridiales Family XIII bacterium]|jgi:acyl carrier protein|nr:acyl carrier protein [Clostridiales Family XIII bacterium]
MDIREEIISTLAERAARMFAIDRDGLGPDTRFEEDLNSTSVNIVQFTAALEDIYEIEVPFMEFKRKSTFAEAADYVAGLLGL